MVLKKTDQDNLSKAEQRRYESIVQIQTMLREGYAPVQIKEMLRATYFRIRRYATGDPLKLCRFQGDKASEASQYRDAIIGLLTQNATKRQALEQITALGYQGKRTAFEVYCRKLICELGIPYMPLRNATGVLIDPDQSRLTQRYVSKSDMGRYLWSGKEMELSDIGFIFDKYPRVTEIQRCILDETILKIV